MSLEKTNTKKPEENPEWLAYRKQLFERHPDYAGIIDKGEAFVSIKAGRNGKLESIKIFNRKDGKLIFFEDLVGMSSQEDTKSKATRASNWGENNL